MVIATAYMRIDEQIIRSGCHDFIVQAKEQALVFLKGFPASSGEGDSNLRVYHTAPDAVIELQVTATGSVNLADKFVVGFDDILSESLLASVNIQCGGEQLGAGEISVDCSRGKGWC